MDEVEGHPIDAIELGARPVAVNANGLWMAQAPAVIETSEACVCNYRCGKRGLLQLGASGASSLREQAKVARADGGVFIGMTAAQVLASKWGKPITVNRTQTADSVSEQWVYGGHNYLYFRNGLLESIQN